MTMDEREALILSALPMAKKMAGFYTSNRGLDYEEGYQEACLGLCRAADKYEPERGVPFDLYAKWWVKKYLLALMECKYAAPVCVPLEDEFLAVENAWAIDTEQHVIHNLNEICLFDGSEHLTTRERTVISLRCGEGCDNRPLTIMQTAEVLGVSHTTVENSWRAAVGKLRQSVGGEKCA